MDLRSLFDQVGEELNKKQKAIDAQSVFFDSDEEALAYAKRLANLKPGDVVGVPDADTGKIYKAVYAGTYPGCPGVAIILHYNTEDKSLILGGISLPLIRLDD